MEIYAAASAIARIPIGSEIEIFSNSKSLVAWVNRGEFPPTSEYAAYVDLYKQFADCKAFPSIKATWVKKGECPRLDKVRTYALTR